MEEQHLILATAGHVDHGKTALIKALTGTDTDRLPEEKARGLTIDLGFAHLVLPLEREPKADVPGVGDFGNRVSLGVIDVPGHEDFVRNMIAGIGSIDLALLVVAADDGWMPQTEEHVQILNYLDVRHGVVVITKSDLGEGERAAAQAREKLRGTSLADAPIVSTSARKRTGLDELKTTLAAECARIPRARDVAKPRLFVDRAFTIAGAGTVVTGTLTGGRFTRGETVTVQPQNLRARIRAIQSHNQSREVASPSTRTALNLSDVRVDDLPRGSVVTSVAADASTAIDAHLVRSPRMGARACALKNGATVHLHYGSGHWIARVALLDRSELAPGEGAIARLFLRAPIFAFAGDRFILRDSSARKTLAGGVILDPDAGLTNARAASQRRFLSERASAPNDLVTLILTQLRRDNFAKRATLLLKSSFGESEIAAALDRLEREGKILASGELAIEPGWWRDREKEARAAIEAEHAAHPEKSGMSLRDLRRALAIADEELFDALIERLCRHGFSAGQGMIGRRTHERRLPPGLADAAASLRAAIGARPFDPPSRKQLIGNGVAQQALKFLSETGEIVILNEEVILAADAFTKMKSLIAETLRERGAATASELRQSLGTSRRVLIPVLESCDRDGLTIREGDRRRLRRANPVR